MTHLSSTRRTPIGGTALRFTILLSLLSLFASLAAAPVQAVTTPTTQGEASHTNDVLNLAYHTYMPVSSNQTGSLTISVTALVDQPSSRECRRTFTFTGQIKVSGPATIKYQWERSTGEAPEVNVIQFTQAGAQEVYHLWPVNGPADGWAQLRVLSPISAVSGLIPYVLTCDKPRMAYIYNNDIATRDSFYQFFYNKEYEVDLVSQYAVTAHPNTALWGNIVIGPDTRWAAGSAETQKIDNLNRPVLGIGEGGRTFFQAIAMDIGTNGWSAAGKEVVPVNPQDQFWRGITTGATVPLYTADSPLVAVYNPQAKAGFLRIGRQTPSSDAHHYPLVAQEKNGQCHKLWGFSGTPNLMTAEGKQLFTNMFLQTSCPPAITSVKMTIEEVYCSDSLEAVPPQGNGDEVYFRLQANAANGYSSSTNTAVRTEVMRGISYKPDMQTLTFSDPGEWLQLNVEGVEQDPLPEVDDGNNTLSGIQLSLTRDQLFAWFGTTAYLDLDLTGSNGTGAYRVRVAVTVE